MAMEYEASADALSLSGLKTRVDALYLNYIFPVLATIRLGEDPAAVDAEAELLAAAKTAGVIVRRYLMPDTLTREDLELLIGQINADPLLSALLLERPLPARLDAEALFGMIAPKKRIREASVREILNQVIDAAERSAQ